MGVGNNNYHTCLPALPPRHQLFIGTPHNLPIKADTICTDLQRVNDRLDESTLCPANYDLVADDNMVPQ